MVFWIYDRSLSLRGRKSLAVMSLALAATLIITITPVAPAFAATSGTKTSMTPIPVKRLTSAQKKYAIVHKCVWMMDSKCKSVQAPAVYPVEGKTAAQKAFGIKNFCLWTSATDCELIEPSGKYAWMLVKRGDRLFDGKTGKEVFFDSSQALKDWFNVPNPQWVAVGGFGENPKGNWWISGITCAPGESPDNRIYGPSGFMLGFYTKLSVFANGCGSTATVLN